MAQQEKPWIQRGVDIALRIIQKWGKRPDAIEKARAAAEAASSGEPQKVFPTKLTADPKRGGLTEEGWMGVEMTLAQHLGVPNMEERSRPRQAKHDPSRNGYQKKYQKNRYHERKKQAIDMLGGKCTVCGTTRKLELDHKNPDKKSFNITKLWSVPEAEFKKEVRKCKLLCNKHHKERTSKQRESGEVKSIPGKTQYNDKGRKTKTRRKKASLLRSLSDRVAAVSSSLE